MSNSLAIAAVTTTLQNLIFLGVREELGSGRITALPLDKARSGHEGNQVNLFMYHTAPNMAWKNLPKASRPKNSTKDKPPLGLDLYYVITTYGEKDSEAKSHRLLGRVMSILHDRSQLSRAEIEAATAIELPESDLHHQVDQLTIKPLHLTFEEMTQVWRVFQAQYRPSVAFEVSVVLIDSTLPLNLALPVLPRLPDNRGAIALVGMDGPRLQEVRLPNRQRAAQWGDTVTIRGTGLDHPDIQVQLVHPQISDPILLTPLPDRQETELKIRIPTPEEQPEVVSQWRAGFYALSLVMPREQGQWTSEALSLAIAPILLSVDLLTDITGALSLTLACSPTIQFDQKVLVLFGAQGKSDIEIESVDDSTQATSLRVKIQTAKTGVYVVRLRVDGVESIPVDFTASPPQFATNQTIVIQN